MCRFISVILTIMLIITCINPCSAQAQIAVEVLDEAGPFIIEDAQIIGSTIVVGGVAIYEIVKRSTEQFGTLLQPYLIVRLDERDYNDAKDKGVPVPGKNKDESTANRLDSVGMPYSSQRLFQDGTDEKNGCPKQIRYYGKDGKAERDIDFYHMDEGIGFPHIHTWRHDLVAQGIKDTKLTRPHLVGDVTIEAIKIISNNWKCKNYDFKTHTFKKGGL